MFEDDFDIDEIIGSEQITSSLKRQNFDSPTHNFNKKLKTEHEDALSTSTTTHFKKVFRFKKKEPLQAEHRTDNITINANNISSSPIAGILQQENEKTKVFVRKESYSKNLTTYGSGNSVSKQSPTKNVCDTSTIKRSFPGPAGVLSESSLNTSILEISNDFPKTKSKEEICMESSVVSLNEDLWDMMKTDFRSEKNLLLDKYNIQWIKTMKSAKKLINQKAPFLAVYIQCIRHPSIDNPTVNIILKDNTGTIEGTVIHDVYEEYSGSLKVGSVIVLIDVGVLTIRHNGEPYLTITKNNLISIYTDSKGVTDSLTQVSNGMSKVVLRNLSANEILRMINKTKELNKIQVEKTLGNIQSIYFSNKVVKVPVNINETSRLIAQNVKNLEESNSRVLLVKPVVVNNSVDSSKNCANNPGNSSTKKENMDNVMDFFGSQEDLNEFFENEPNFCSTQNSKETVNKSVVSKMETCDKAILENSKIFEDAFEGVDASALFDEF